MTRQVYQAVGKNGWSDVYIGEDDFIKRLQKLLKSQYSLAGLEISPAYTSHINIPILNRLVHSFQRNWNSPLKVN